MHKIRKYHHFIHNWGLQRVTIQLFIVFDVGGRAL